MARSLYDSAYKFMGHVPGGLAIDGAGIDQLWQNGPRYAEDCEQFVVPVKRVDIENQRAAGVTHIGRVAPPAGEPPPNDGRPYFLFTGRLEKIMTTLTARGGAPMDSRAIA